MAGRQKSSNPISNVRSLVSETVLEMKKSNWPSRKELYESTLIVIVSVVMMAVFVGVSDKVLMLLLRLLAPSN